MSARTKKEIMTPAHAYWAEFIERLEEAGEVGIGLQVSETGEVESTCEGKGAFAHTRAVLKAMGGLDSAGTVAWLREHGAGCDCTVIFNCDR